MAVATTAGFHYRFKHDYAVAVTAGFHYAGNYFFNISRIQLIKVGGGGGGGNCISAKKVFYQLSYYAILPDAIGIVCINRAYSTIQT